MGVVTVTGTVFNDNTGSGSTTVSGTGIGKVTVYDDANGNGVLDTGEISTTTATDGTYTLSAVPAGNDVIRVVVPTGYVATDTGQGSQTVTAPATGVNFPLYLTMTVEGTVYYDSNANNRRDVTESGAQGVRVYQDLNGNGIFDTGEPSTIVNASGAYTLTGIAPSRSNPGNISVLVVPPAGYQVELTGTGIGNAPGNTEFLNAPLTNESYIYGSVQYNTSAGGISSPGGQIVYEDLNDNGVLDANEPSTTTDATGKFILGNLKAGTVTLGIVTNQYYSIQNDSQTVSVPSLGVGFANFDVTSTTTPSTGSISGTVFNDANLNGFDDPGELPVVGATVYIDSNDNGVFDAGEPTAVSDSSGMYLFNGLSVGTYSVRQELPVGYVSALPESTVPLESFSGATSSFAGVNLGSKYELVNVSGTVFVDQGGTGSTTVTASSVGMANVTVFDDENGNGILDAGEPSTTTTASGAYSFLVPAGSAVLRVLPPSGFTDLSATGDAQAITAPATGVNFPLFAGMTLDGFVFFDSNGNQKLDYNEVGASGVRVYQDLTNSGSYVSSDPSALTNSSGQFTLAGLVPNASHAVIVRVVPSGSYVSETSSSAFSPSSGAVFTPTFGMTAGNEVGGTVDALVSAGYIGSSGQTLYLDLNNDGIFESNEPSVQTDGYGNYSFGSVSPGTYVLRIQLLSGFNVAPGTDSSKTLTVTSTGNYGWSFTVSPASVTSDGAIYGQLYNDANEDGIDDPGEVPLEGRTVYIDSNDDGVLDNGDISTQTNSVGEYGFYGLTAGTYIVRQIVPTGVTALIVEQSITLKPDTYGLYTYTGVNFGSYTPSSSIYGNVYDDINKDNIQETSEPGLAGWTVFIDQNSNGVLDSDDISTTTDATGHYLFTGVSNGNYVMSIVPPLGWTKTVSSEYLAQVVLGRSAVINFGAYPSTASISGSVFQDNNGNGTQDTGEPDLAGRTVYLDMNNDGIFDTGDISTTSTTSGYSFPHVTPGTYELREVLPAGWERTDAVGNPSIQVTATANFITTASFGTVQPTLTASAGGPYTVAIGGSVTLSAQGSVDTGNNIVSYEWDENYNGQTFNPAATGVTTSFSTSGLSAGATRTVAVRVTDAAGLVRIATTTVSILNIGTVTGEVLFGPVGETVYLDANNNGVLDAGELSTTTFDEDVFGGPSFQFENVPAGHYVLRQIPPQGYVQTYPYDNAGSPITVTSSQITTQNLDLASLSSVNSIRGVVYNSAPGEIVYVDYNNNDSPAGDPTSTVNSLGVFEIDDVTSGTYTLRQQLPSGYTQGAPAANAGISLTLSGGVLTGQNFTNIEPTAAGGGSISGTVFDDASFDGQPTEVGEAGIVVFDDANGNGTLDPGELVTATTSSGSYSFTGLPSGNYTIRAVLPASFSQTVPANNAGIQVTLASNQAVTGENFSQQDTYAANDIYGSIDIPSGVTYPPTGTVVYLDANDNGTLDPGEISTLTDNGYFYFYNVPLGSYYVRQIVPTGFTQTTPAANSAIAITVGASATQYAAEFADSGSFAPIEIEGFVDGGPGGQTVFLDTNGNGTLDPGEVATISSAYGAYEFDNVPAGSYVLRQVLPSGYTQVSPNSGAGISITVSPGTKLTAENFTDFAGTDEGSVSGTVTGSTAGETVYLDANNNGVLDTGELHDHFVHRNLQLRHRPGWFVRHPPSAAERVYADFAGEQRGHRGYRRGRLSAGGRELHRCGGGRHAAAADRRHHRHGRQLQQQRQHDREGDRWHPLDLHSTARPPAATGLDSISEPHAGS